MTVSYDRIFTHDDATSLLQKQTDIKNSIDALTTAVTNHNETNYVDRSTSQSVGGTKTFTSAPLISDTIADSDDSTKAATTSWINSTFFGKLVTHLAASTAATISSLSTDSLFYRMLSWALTASGVQYNLTNSSAWYIKLGSLFGGLIIQGGYESNGSSAAGTWVNKNYPISFSTACIGIVGVSVNAGNYYAQFQSNTTSPLSKHDISANASYVYAHYVAFGY